MMKLPSNYISETGVPDDNNSFVFRNYPSFEYIFSEYQVSINGSIWLFASRVIK